jgi:hypothetical protein
MLDIRLLLSVYSEAISAEFSKLVGLEIFTLLGFLAVYFGINKKLRLYDNLHFLGYARPLVVLVPSTILAVPFGMISIYKGIAAIVVYFILFWVVTTEVVVRGVIALFTAIVAGGASWFVCMKISPSNALVTIIVPGLIGFISMLATYSIVLKSSWFGERCPHCTTRGSVNTRQVGKAFLGTTSERSSQNGDATIVYYNKYLITYENNCLSCSQTWISTSETKERC